MRCIFCLDPSPPSGFSKEHVFPEAVGGTFSIFTVCTACNNRLGRFVDVTVAGHSLVALKRMAAGIKGKSGTIPNPLSRASLADDPTEKLHLTFDPSKPGETDIYVIPHVKVDPEAQTIHVRVDGRDLGRLREIVNKAVTRAGGKELSQEEVDALTKQVERTEQPTVQAPLSIDVSEYRRGLMKIIYELACHWLGDSYADEPTAALMRQFIFDEKLPFEFADKYPFNGIMTMSKGPLLPFWPDERDHLIGCLLVTGKTAGITVSVLGVLDACIRVTDDAKAYAECSQRFLCINPTTGARRESTFEAEVCRITDRANAGAEPTPE